MEIGKFKLTFNFFYFPFPGYAGCLEIFKISLKLDPFLTEKQQQHNKLDIGHGITSMITVYGIFWHPYLHHHDFEGKQFLALPFAQSTFKFIHKHLSFPNNGRSTSE